MGEGHTGARAAEHEYHSHLCFVKFGFLVFGRAGEMQRISDLLYEVGCHRGLDRVCVLARQVGGRSGGDVRTRGKSLRGDVLGRNRLRRRRVPLLRIVPGSVQPSGSSRLSTPSFQILKR
jgi:hypothetical protein